MRCRQLLAYEVVAANNMVSPSGPVAVRLACAAVGGAAAAGVAVAVGGWTYAPPVGWAMAGIVFVVWTWLAVGRMDADCTRSHATREDPTRALTEVMMVLASVASLAGVGYLLLGSSSHGAAADLAAGIGIISVASAWFVVHTVFCLRYASLYYGGDPVGGIDFNQDEPPAYVDFAYLAFTLGMTFQVSDTDLTTRRIRATALRHALLSYLLGAVVLAVTINLVAGLGSSGG